MSYIPTYLWKQGVILFSSIHFYNTVAYMVFISEECIHPNVTQKPQNKLSNCAVKLSKKLSTPWVSNACASILLHTVV